MPFAGDPIFVVRSDWWLAKNHFLEGEPASVYDRDLDDHAMAIELGFLSSKSMKGIARNSGFDLECLKILEIGKVTRQEWEAMPVQGSIYQRMARGFGKGVPLSR